jgi:hypothetical protein
VGLFGADSAGADLVGVGLVGVGLVGVGLVGADMVGVDLVGMGLVDADLVGADLVGVGLVGVGLVGADLACADMVVTAIVGLVVTAVLAVAMETPLARNSLVRSLLPLIICCIANRARSQRGGLSGWLWTASRSTCMALASTAFFLPMLQHVRLNNVLHAVRCRSWQWGNVRMTFTTACTPPIALIPTLLSSWRYVKRIMTRNVWHKHFSSKRSSRSVTN